MRTAYLDSCLCSKNMCLCKSIKHVEHCDNHLCCLLHQCNWHIIRCNICTVCAKFLNYLSSASQVVDYHFLYEKHMCLFQKILKLMPQVTSTIRFCSCSFISWQLRVYYKKDKKHCQSSNSDSLPSSAQVKNYHI